MTKRPVPSRIEDKSSEAGFQYVFYCDLCDETYESDFVKSKTYKAGGGRTFLKAVSIGATLLGDPRAGSRLERAFENKPEPSDDPARFNAMSPEWHHEHQAAFAKAQEEVQLWFHQCSRCGIWVCDSHWNDDEERCTSAACGIAASPPAPQGYCPACGAAAGPGPFCSNCGARLPAAACPQCGRERAQGAAFCPQCGCRLP